MRNIDTCFGRMLNYLDQVPENEYVTRKELLWNTYGTVHRHAPTTVDKWKRQLIVCGYLKETGTPGLYQKGKKIPEMMTTTWLAETYSEVLDWIRRTK